MRETEIDFQAFDYRRLGPAQRAAVMHHALRRARIERSRAVRAMATGLAALLRQSAAVAIRWYRTRALRRRQRMIADELRGMDDHLLRDIGVRRCEIVSLVTMGDKDDTRVPRPASRRAA